MKNDTKSHFSFQLLCVLSLFEKLIAFCLEKTLTSFEKIISFFILCNPISDANSEILFFLLFFSFFLSRNK